jgi:hypothetical protein
MLRSSASHRLAGGPGFPENCPWEAGPEDHIQVDLVMKERLKAQGGRLNALVNNAAISPK